jgi:hypothetical protein
MAEIKRVRVLSVEEAQKLQTLVCCSTVSSDNHLGNQMYTSPC